MPMAANSAAASVPMGPKSRNGRRGTLAVKESLAAAVRIRTVANTADQRRVRSRPRPSRNRRIGTPATSANPPTT